MKNKILKLAAVAIILATSFGALAQPVMAVDCSNQSALTTSQAIQCGANGASGNTQDTADSSKAATDKVNTTITNVINLLSVVVGIAAVIMIIMAGFRYVTSGGKQESVTSAKNSLMYAVVGLVIVALAQVIARFVLQQTTKSP